MVCFKSADWIAGNLTPVFILKCINDSSKWSPTEDEGNISKSGSNVSGGDGSGNSNSRAGGLLGGESTSSSSVASSAAASSSSATLNNVLNGNVSFGSLCQSSASK